MLGKDASASALSRYARGIAVRLGLTLCSAFAIFTVAENSPAVSATDDNTPQVGAKTQYQILFSRDDSFCTTLGGFYNRHLHDYDDEKRGLIENQFGSELRGGGVEFLSERMNWRPPEQTLSWRQFLPEVDIYNDGSPRTVITQELTYSESLGRSTFDTQTSTVAIFKPGIGVNEARKLIDEAGFNSPEIEQQIDFGHGGSSLGPVNSTYTIQEIPPRSSLGGGPPIRASIGSTYQRLVRSQGRIYGIARYQSLAIGSRIDDVIRPNAPITRGYLLVYSPMPSGAINDICVLEIAYTSSFR